MTAVRKKSGNLSIEFFALALAPIGHGGGQLFVQSNSKANRQDGFVGG
jgi:hypothetical protein